MSSDSVFVVKTTLDERLHWTNREMPNDSGPALVSHNGRLWVAWTGSDRRLNLMSSSDGIHFEDKVVLDERSSAQPAIAVHQDCLIIAWSGTARKLNVARLERTR